MHTYRSIAFFDRQFQSQAKEMAHGLNPFEKLALPYLTGDVLDFGCGMGNLSFEAARRGCRVVALDASQAAIEHIQARSKQEGMAVSARVADLRNYPIDGDFDCVVSIGLLMFFDCQSAYRVLSELQDRVRPGGVAVINVLIEGTTYFDMFDPSGYCLFDPLALQQRFAGWTMERMEYADFAAPQGTLKRFVTLVACKA